MATRLYFAANADPWGLTPAFDAGWEFTSEGVRRVLFPAKRDAGEALAVGTQLGPWTAGNDAVDRQFLSFPLFGDQSVSGTVKCQVASREFNNGDNSTSRMGIRVLSGDGGSVRGTCLAVANYGPTTELINNVTLRNKTYANSDAITTVAALNGDRLCVEIGYSDAAGSTPEGQSRWGCPVGTSDHGENETETTSLVGWIEFSANLVFVTNRWWDPVVSPNPIPCHRLADPRRADREVKFFFVFAPPPPVPDTAYQPSLAAPPHLAVPERRPPGEQFYQPALGEWPVPDAVPPPLFSTFAPPRWPPTPVPQQSWVPVAEEVPPVILAAAEPPPAVAAPIGRALESRAVGLDEAEWASAAPHVRPAARPTGREAHQVAVGEVVAPPDRAWAPSTSRPIPPEPTPRGAERHQVAVGEVVAPPPLSWVVRSGGPPASARWADRTAEVGPARQEQPPAVPDHYAPVSARAQVAVIRLVGASVLSPREVEVPPLPWAHPARPPTLATRMVGAVFGPPPPAQEFAALVGVVGVAFVVSLVVRPRSDPLVVIPADPAAEHQYAAKLGRVPFAWGVAPPARMRFDVILPQQQNPAPEVGGASPPPPQPGRPVVRGVLFAPPLIQLSVPRPYTLAGATGILKPLDAGESAGLNLEDAGGSGSIKHTDPEG